MPTPPRLAPLLTPLRLLQAALGISTLLLIVPLPLALAHQGGALILFTLALCLAHAVRLPSGQQAAASFHMKPAE